MAQRDAWKHMEGHPGYFVTEDGLKQMRLLSGSGVMDPGPGSVPGGGL